MPDQNKKDSEASRLERLAGAGEDALTRLVDELGRNTRVTEALSRAMNAKDRVVSGVGQVGFSASGEVAELRERLEKLEKRLAKLEGSGSKAKRSSSARKASASTSTKASGGTAPPSAAPKPSSGPPSN
jgi:chaperonin cofactor prefoldin